KQADTLFMTEIYATMNSDQKVIFIDELKRRIVALNALEETKDKGTQLADKKKVFISRTLINEPLSNEKEAALIKRCAEEIATVAGIFYSDLEKGKEFAFINALYHEMSAENKKSFVQAAVDIMKIDQAAGKKIIDIIQAYATMNQP